MKDFGRISVCGAISVYNDDPVSPTVAPCAEPAFVFKQLKMEGFLVHRWLDRWMEGLAEMIQWIKDVKLILKYCTIIRSIKKRLFFSQGKIKVRETYTEGFENMPKAFIEMLSGGNTGKAIIKV